MWMFKMFFKDDGEFFEYDPLGMQGAAGTEKALPYLESLLSFLELDPADWEPLLQQATAGLEQFLSTGDPTYTDRMMQTLAELSAKHIYFQLLYLQWFARKATGKIESRMAEELRLRLLPAQLTAYRKQAQRFLERILDIDQVGREVRKNMREAYLFDGPRDNNFFHFEPTPISLGVIRGGDCGEILYPNTIRDLIDFSIRECVRREIPVRRCRSCGRYFPITGRITAEYCSRPSSSGKLCRSTAPVRKWAESRRSDQVFQEYRREYKRRFAWIKAGKLTEEQFAAWHKAAKARKKDCDREIISLDEFKSWLKNS
ncbi:DUF6076 domain-containing protein [Oscillibacter sp. CU971]|uniref:DUF6076 domain-containing protein n=1 Tax=Oscillibacter sp. CU971 TaxID=2780102 RepID=UPI001958F9F1|nr:DUF6076 domain-containing protein [Oscillibacter sp. CU971]